MKPSLNSLPNIQFGSIPANILDLIKTTSLGKRRWSQASDWSPLSTMSSLSTQKSNTSDYESLTSSSVLSTQNVNINSDDLVHSLLPISIGNVSFETFYKRSDSNPFQFKLSTNKNITIDYDEVKKDLQSIITDVKNDYTTLINMIIDDDKQTYTNDNFQFTLTTFTKLVSILSRVYLCVIVNQLYDEKKITSKDTLETLRDRVTVLQTKLKDTIPFLLQLENVNDFLSAKNNSSNN